MRVASRQSALLGALHVLWIVVGRVSSMPDLSAFPTTSYRWSMFIMGGVTAGVVEEAAFRGYMQTGIERYDRRSAVWITSLVFVAAHITQGLGAVLLLGPGLFVASMLYGTRAQWTGTILPGIVVHTVGDLAYMYSEGFEEMAGCSLSADGSCRDLREPAVSMPACRPGWSEA